MPLLRFVWETGTDFHRPEEMNCALARGDAQNRFALVFHALTESAKGAPVDSSDAGDSGGASPGDELGDTGMVGAGHPSEALAGQINKNPFLIGRLRGCQAQHAHVPNFVAVDFYDTSDVIEASQKLNDLIP